MSRGDGRFIVVSMVRLLLGLAVSKAVEGRPGDMEMRSREPFFATMTPAHTECTSGERGRREPLYPRSFRALPGVDDSEVAAQLVSGKMGNRS